MAKAKTVSSTRSLSKQDKKDHVSAYLASGSEMNEYAKSVGVPYKSFWSWVNRYRDEIEAGATEEIESEEDLPTVSDSNGHSSSANGHAPTGSTSAHDMSVYAAEVARLKSENARLRKVLTGQQKIIAELV